MQIKPSLLLASLLAVALCGGCVARGGSAQASPGGSAAGSPGPRSGGESSDVSVAALAPKVSIPGQDTLLQVVNANFDPDQNQEQILALKNREKPDEPISIGVVDFDPAKNEYALAWRHPTLATNAGTFTITTEDLLGDHFVEIVCSGTDEKGEQTLDVFRGVRAPGSANLAFTPIFSDAVKGSIEIERSDRSEAYTLGENSGASFPIDTYIQDPESANLGDLLETNYTWDGQAGSYEETGEQHIPGKQIDDQRLAALYAAGSDAFETFLAGPWYKTSDDTTGDDATPSAEDSPSDPAGGLKGVTILFFDPSAREVSLYSGDVMEIYVWENSYRTLYNSLVISGYNELVQYIKAQISVSVVSLDRIEVYLPDSWAGTYLKLTKSMQDSLLKGTGAQPKLPRLSGEYLGESGDRLTFNGVRFTQEGKNRTQSGGYSLFDYGQPVIELRYIEPDGIVTGTKVYKLSFHEEKSPERIVRTLNLTPGELGIGGFSASGDPPIRYVQVEDLGQKN